MSNRPHVVRPYIEWTGTLTFNVECPGNVGPAGNDDCAMWTEADHDHEWPGPHGCNCTDPECEDCPAGDHDCCGGDWPRVDVLGIPGCKHVRAPGCGYHAFAADLDEHFIEAEWPRELPIWARVEWVEGYPVLAPFRTDLP